jgi:hypothetical protein
MDQAALRDLPAEMITSEDDRKMNKVKLIKDH